MNKIILDVYVEKPIRFKTMFPIIIPNNCNKIDFNILNINDFKNYNLYVSQIKNSKDIVKIKVVNGVFSIPLIEFENKNNNFILYAIKGEEINTYSFDKEYIKVNKTINLTNEEKFSKLIEQVFNQLHNLDSRVKEIEEELNSNVLL